MLNIMREPDYREIKYDGAREDGVLTLRVTDKKIDVKLTAEASKPTFIILKWYENAAKETKILGDAWERAYADLAWRGFESTRYMPWYFLATSGSVTVGCGVKTGASSFVSFMYDVGCVTCLIDVRSGSYGVELNGRTLEACSILRREYTDISPFEAACEFCKAMCDNPILPKEPVYGGNNWYYAYGESSREEILSDAELQAELSKGNAHKAFMVIDDCWQKKSCCGPWDPNEKFGDMKTLADEIKEKGVRPGIWVRFLTDSDERIPDSRRFSSLKDAPLDPSNPEVLDFVKATVKKIREWGYELIKHDFSTYDIFGSWGFQLKDTITNSKTLRFFDSTKTSAEIVLNLYRAVREEAGDCLVIGCNTVSHLSAGLVEINRTGDDTSGKEWARTLRYGVNTLAFRMAQHGAFYAADADCVGILGENIPWELNSQWLDLLKRSGTPLFVSCARGSVTPEIFKELKEAYKFADENTHAAEPADWLWNNLPQVWKTESGETVNYEWFKNVKA